MGARQPAEVAGIGRPLPQPPEPRGPARAGRQSPWVMAFDVAAPVALYYGLRSAGASVWLALLGGAVAPALVRAARRRGHPPRSWPGRCRSAWSRAWAAPSGQSPS